ncbi:Thyroglobulin [Merluccius polli]|uniref:Thyroglobulin n=1 Tax=Merluccius polli TaxID=89951 RepID=A0AA47LZ17_MERPO|nr:Thyroglobulin [Merluccius polli]
MTRICPTPCEVERRAAQGSSGAFVPSCQGDGSFSPMQCQLGELCWCVDPRGREVPGTQQPGDTLTCGSGQLDCPSQRRLALSRLLSSGPLDPPGPLSDRTPGLPGAPAPLCSSPSCPSSRMGAGEPVSFLTQLGEALARSSPGRLQENLFGGKFLKNAAVFNFSGAVGERGSFQNLDQRLDLGQSALNQKLVRLVSRALEDPGFLSVLQQTLVSQSHTHADTLQQRASLRGPDPAVYAQRSLPAAPVSQCRVLVRHPQGAEVAGSRTATGAGPPRCPSRCERERALALTARSLLAAAARVYVPACSGDGSFLPLQCDGERCFCVDHQGAETPSLAAGGDVSSLRRSQPSKTETDRIISLSNASHLPLGEGFLLAQGIHLTPEELHVSQSAEPAAAVQMYWRPQRSALLRLSYQPYTPQCDAHGLWLPTQCHPSTGPSRCQRAQVRTLLSGWMKGSDIMVSYQPQCEEVLAGVSSKVSSVSQTEALFPCSVTSLPAGRTVAWRVTMVTRTPWLQAASYVTSNHNAGGEPLAGACQRSQVFQTLQTTADWSLPLSEETTCLSLLPRLEADLTANMATRGLCSLLLPVSGRSVSVCDDASFRLHCESDDIMSLNVKWMAMLSDIPTSDLPDLHDLGKTADIPRGDLRTSDEPRLVDGVQGILGNYPSLGTSELVARTTPSFGCASGFHPDTGGLGVVSQDDVSSGSSSSKGACLLCPEGTYQEEDGRDFCNKCPRGSSAIGASSVRQCEANATISRTECQRQGLRCSEDGSFLPAQPDFLSGTWRCVTSQGAELVWTNSKTPLTDGECRACAAESSCHHVALFTENGETHCQLYSTHCQRTARGFLGNPEVEWVSKVTCVLRVRGGAKDLLVVRKKGNARIFSSRLQKSFERMRMRKALSGVVRTVAFSSAETTLTTPTATVRTSSILCGLMRTPSVLQCADQDGTKQQRSLVFNFGGQEFTITDSALPADSKNKTDYQASIISFQAIYLQTGSEVAAVDRSSCKTREQLPLVDGCDEEEQCSLVDVRQDDSDIFHSCLLFPDSTVCGAYDKKLRQPCRPLLARRPNNAYKKKVDLSGPVKSFHTAGSPFQKMVSYSVRSRVPEVWSAVVNEDPCCRGIGFVRDSKSPVWGSKRVPRRGVKGRGPSRTCRPSAVETTPYPLGWYQKPGGGVMCRSVNQPDRVCYPLRAVSGHQGLWPQLLSPAPLAPPPPADWFSESPASLVYLKKERLPSVTSVLIPGHGTLRGVTVETTLGSDRKSVVRYLGDRSDSERLSQLFGPAAGDATKPRASCLQPGDEDSPASSEDCLYLNIFTPTGLTGPVPVLVFFFNPSANQSPGLLDGSTLAAVGNIVVVTASFRTAALGFLSTGHSGLRGNYGMLDQAAVLRWVDAHIFLVGGDNRRVTVGAERRGADITSLHLLSSSSSPPLFQRMMLMFLSSLPDVMVMLMIVMMMMMMMMMMLKIMMVMLFQGGSVFSPAALQSSSVARRQAVELASQLGCMTSDPSSPSEEDKMAACLRQTPVHALNAAQTKLLAASGPFQAWSPVSDGVLLSIRQPISRSYSHRVPLLIGTSAEDGLISRAAKIKDFEALQGRADSKTAFYEALTRSLGGERSSPLVKQAASWFYSLQHSASPAGYNLLSRALNNATRDQFIVCPVQQMASHWASNKANVFLYHLPENSVHHSADRAVPLDVQFAFGTPHHPINSQRFGSSGRRLSLAVMTYVANFIKTGYRHSLLTADFIEAGDPNRAQSGSRRVPGAGLPQWGPVLPSPASPQYKELDPSLQQQQGLHQAECSFWTELVPELNGETGDLLIKESFSGMEKGSHAPRLTLSHTVDIVPRPCISRARLSGADTMLWNILTLCFLLSLTSCDDLNQLKTVPESPTQFSNLSKRIVNSTDV